MRAVLSGSALAIFQRTFSSKNGGIQPLTRLTFTAAAIAEAVVNNKPLTHRVVTVTGEAIANPGNYYVPVGTTVEELLEFCGGIIKKSAKCSYVIIDLPPVAKTCRMEFINSGFGHEVECHEMNDIKSFDASLAEKKIIWITPDKLDELEKMPAYDG